MNPIPVIGDTAIFGSICGCVFIVRLIWETPLSVFTASPTLEFVSSLPDCPPSTSTLPTYPSPRSSHHAQRCPSDSHSCRSPTLSPSPFPPQTHRLPAHAHPNSVDSTALQANFLSAGNTTPQAIHTTTTTTAAAHSDTSTHAHQIPHSAVQPLQTVPTTTMAASSCASRYSTRCRPLAGAPTRLERTGTARVTPSTRASAIMASSPQRCYSTVDGSRHATE